MTNCLEGHKASHRTSHVALHYYDIVSVRFKLNVRLRFLFSEVWRDSNVHVVRSDLSNTLSTDNMTPACYKKNFERCICASKVGNES